LAGQQAHVLCGLCRRASHVDDLRDCDRNVAVRMSFRSLVNGTSIEILDSISVTKVSFEQATLERGMLREWDMRPEGRSIT
jgi:hypothetical protein